MIEFSLPIRVVPKHDGGGWRDAVRHRKLLANKAAIQSAAQQYAYAFYSGPLIVDTWFVLRAPRDIVKSMTAELANCLEPHTRKPDTDNMRKQVLDSLQGMFYENDSQVCGGVELKTWGPSDEVRIRIREADAADVAAMWNTMKG